MLTVENFLKVTIKYTVHKTVLKHIIFFQSFEENWLYILYLKIF